MWALILHVTGVDDVSGRWYAFWSGFGGILIGSALATSIALVGRWAVKHVRHGLHIHHHHHHHGHDPSTGSPEVDHDSA